MAKNSSPEIQAAFTMLRDQGDMFSDRRITTLDYKQTQIDPAVLAEQGAVYVADTQLSVELQRRDMPAISLEAARRCIAAYFEKDKLIWGFSGFATAGYSYAAEAEGIMGLYDTLRRADSLPALAIDGGVSAGNLGLSGVVAEMHGVDTMGFIPRRGLDSIAPRDHLVVWGESYKDREVLVGTAPDVLVCIGGGEGTRRECRQAVKVGGTVLLLALKDYGPHSLPETYRQHESLQNAAEKGQLVVCASPEQLVGSVETIAAAHPVTSRDRRAAVLDTLLLKQARM